MALEDAGRSTNFADHTTGRGVRTASVRCMFSLVNAPVQQGCERWAGRTEARRQLFDDLSFRFSRSCDIRAASLAERFDQTAGGGTITDRFLDDAQDTISTVQGGNPEVSPEQADTLTFGFVYQPSWLSNLAVSVDFFDSSLSNAITQMGLAAIMNECYEQNAFCNPIIRGGDGLITHVNNVYVNLDEARTRGVDIEMTAVRPICSVAGKIFRSGRSAAICARPRSPRTGRTRPSGRGLLRASMPSRIGRRRWA